MLQTLADEITRTGDIAPKPLRSPRSRGQIEVVVSRASALFGLAFASQTIPAVLEQARLMVPVWSIAANVAIFGGLIAAVIAAFTMLGRRFVHAINGYIAFAWFFAMATWPLAMIDPGVVADNRPWPWYLVTVTTAAAAVAWPVWAATVALAVAPLTYGIIRMTPSGGAAPIGSAALDVVYAIILGGVVLIIITMVRAAAASVDSAQSTALARYSNAVGQHATEVERVQVDAIVHDNVLATLLSAGNATTPEARALASSMAANAIGHLREAAIKSRDDQAKISVGELAKRIRSAAMTVGEVFETNVSDPGDGVVPAQAAEAVYSATIQAMVNSAEHAGSGPEVIRWVTFCGTPDGGITVEVGDTGAGFEPGAVPAARIGLRVSIVERVTNEGGEVGVDSHPGEGTVITICWPGRRTETAS